jgi:histidinol-phosphate aminotransferase
LAALRVGFLIASPALVAEIEKVRAPYNVSAFNQRAALWILANRSDEIEAQCREVVSERVRVATALRGVEGIEVFASEANLLLFRVAEAQGLWDRLRDAGILVRYFGESGPLAGCLRVTIGRPEENDTFLAALRAS